jgi:hypothetical protein
MMKPMAAPYTASAAGSAASSSCAWRRRATGLSATT